MEFARAFFVPAHIRQPKLPPGTRHHARLVIGARIFALTLCSTLTSLTKWPAEPRLTLVCQTNESESRRSRRSCLSFQSDPVLRANNSARPRGLKRRLSRQMHTNPAILLIKMALISAKTILTSISLFHMTLGFFFLTSPATVADQTLVYLLGEAMKLPDTRHFESPSPALAFLAIVLAILGVSDLVTLSLPEEISLVHHWGMQAPIRFFIFFVLVGYSYLFGITNPALAASGYPSFSSSSSSSSSSSIGRQYFLHDTLSAGDALKNGVFFTFAFVEMVSWFWAWITLREERDVILARSARREKRRSSVAVGGVPRAGLKAKVEGVQRAW